MKQDEAFESKTIKRNILVVSALIVGLIIGFYIGKGYMIAMMRDNILSLCKLLV